MLKKTKPFLFTFDLVGITPRLFIFDQKRYNSIISSILSIIILSLSISYAFYSFIQYLKFNDPSVSYTKDNEQIEEKKILLKNFFIMFQAFEATSFRTINKSYINFKAQLSHRYFNGTNIDIPLEIENCELGKNLIIEFRNATEDLLKINTTIEEFYCFSSKHWNLSFFYNGQGVIISLPFMQHLKKIMFINLMMFKFF